MHARMPSPHTSRVPSFTHHACPPVDSTPHTSRIETQQVPEQRLDRGREAGLVEQVAALADGFRLGGVRVDHPPELLGSGACVCVRVLYCVLSVLRVCGLCECAHMCAVSAARPMHAHTPSD